MSEIHFVDSTLRDGHQSLWATRMTTSMMLSIAPTMDRAGFKCIEVGATGNHFVAYMRYLRENPWEKLRLLVEAMPNTPLFGSVRSGGGWGFDIQPQSVTSLFISRMAAYGIRRISIFDPLHDFENTAESRRVAKAAGLEVEMPLVFTVSPVHTDEYYAKKATELAKLNVDVVKIKDSIGLLTPERTKTLVPKILKHMKRLPVEIHAHCTTGLAPLCYLEAIKLGVRTVQTCASPLANGNSIPSIENIVNNIRLMGYTSTVDDNVVEAMAAHFRYVAKREGKPLGTPAEYDLSTYEHQIPGGMRSNMESMLALRGEARRLEEVLQETIRVRKELGYPVMITPLSQMMGTQAAFNVVLGERYKMVPDELFKYVLGFYGRPPAPVDPNVLDKILSSARGKEFLKWKPPEPSIEDIRKQIGGNLSDDELLLQLMLPEENIKNILAGHLKTDYPSPATDKPAMLLVKELARRANLAYLHIQKGDFALTLQRK